MIYQFKEVKSGRYIFNYRRLGIRRANSQTNQLDLCGTQTFTISIPIVYVRNYLICLPHIHSLQLDD
jgi:hypothetical protein